MTASRITRRFSTYALVVGLVAAPGCASPGARPSVATAEDSGESPRADASRDAPTMGGEGTSLSYGATSDSAPADVRPATVTTSPEATVVLPPDTRAPGTMIDELGAAQDAERGALAAALDVSDCASAVQLGDEICRLAERVCTLAPDDPRCDEAQNHCARARSRIGARCNGR